MSHTGAALKVRNALRDLHLVTEPFTRLQLVLRPTRTLWEVHGVVVRPTSLAGEERESGVGLCRTAVASVRGFGVWRGWRGEGAGRGMLLGCRLKP
ncbi:hypothetical protein Arub01_10550 [Actinomadura rubrobrunea]|uniref:Uncharacterized protein n=1 Tax=Actinomadura rubrobrunea TaxID=115335 RepID=A0A9W6PTP3_9ACTN|nr:hypothetical protein Arub01_10550 [Actinomadura rubrobrunea]